MKSGKSSFKLGDAGAAISTAATYVASVLPALETLKPNPAEAIRDVLEKESINEQQRFKSDQEMKLEQIQAQKETNILLRMNGLKLELNKNENAEKRSELQSLEREWLILKEDMAREAARRQEEEKVNFEMKAKAIAQEAKENEQQKCDEEIFSNFSLFSNFG